MNVRPAVSCLILGTVMAGCAPVPLGSYYKPLYPAATPQQVSYRGDQCHGASGAPVTLRLILAEGVELQLGSRPAPGGDGRELMLEIELLPGRQLQFAHHQIAIQRDQSPWETISAPDWQLHSRLPVDARQPIDVAALSATPDLLAGPDAPSLEGTLSASYSFKPFMPEHIEVDLPGIQVSTAPTLNVAAPSVTARAMARPELYEGQYRDTRSLVYRTSSQQHVLDQKLQACRSSGQTARQCQRLLDADDGRLQLHQGAFTFDSRWYLYDTRRHEPFRGELSIRFEQPLRWQLDPPRVRVRDPGQPDVSHEHILDTAWLTLAYNAPFGSRVQLAPGLPASGTLAGTRLRLELPLPGPAAVYRVQLPPLLINGKSQPLKVFELERRRFDMGLMPFNC